MAPVKRAVPLVTELTRPFWDAARERRLVIQRCAACGYYNHPPRTACDACISTELSFEPVSGNGTVWSFTVMHEKSIQGFEEAVPYVTALVELVEQPALLMATNLPGSEPGTVTIGERVHVTFEPFGDDGLLLPQFEVQAPS